MNGTRMPPPFALATRSGGRRVTLTGGRSPTTIDYFANAAWSDRAPAMVQSLLIESFEQTGKIISVSRDLAVLRADYILMSELRRFEARYESGE